ncbi:aldehyde dehydrogenase family protein [Streptomyces prunicolor]|uniref:aldehyde dehydrogenase family protein n=1 Tax=Streptomyces prunicolor TaxID=67348 RepID=UPI0037237CF5
MTVTVFDTEQEAVSITNESPYGLLCGICAGDTDRAFRMARAIDVGMVFVNNYFRGILGTPFGGTQHSRFGREHSIETLREFGSTKMISFPSGRGTPPSWRAVDEVFGAGGDANCPPGEGSCAPPLVA